jgi:hypothetical protein
MSFFAVRIAAASVMLEIQYKIHATICNYIAWCSYFFVHPLYVYVLLKFLAKREVTVCMLENTLLLFFPAPSIRVIVAVQNVAHQRGD